MAHGFGVALLWALWVSMISSAATTDARKLGAVVWAQDKEYIFASMRLPGMTERKVDLSDNRIHTFAKFDGGYDHSIEVNLLKAIDGAKSSYKVVEGKSVEFKLRKIKDHGLFWSRLQKEERRPKYILPDWDRWDEDIEEKIDGTYEGGATEYASGSTINQGDMPSMPGGASGANQPDQETMQKTMSKEADKNKEIKQKYPDFPEHFNLASTGLTDEEMDRVAKALANDPDRHARTAAELQGSPDIPKMDVPEYDGSPEEFEQARREGRLPKGFEVPGGMSGTAEHDDDTDDGEVRHRHRRGGSAAESDSREEEEEDPNDENHIEL